MKKSLIIGTLAAMGVGTLVVAAWIGSPIPILVSSFLIGALVREALDVIVRITSRYKIVKR